MNGYFCVLKLFQGAQNFLGDRYQSLRFAEAEQSVWGAFSDLALSARPWEDPVKTALFEERSTPWGRKGRVCRLGSGKVLRSQGAAAPQTDCSA